MIAALAVLLLASTPDPRITLVELQLQGQYDRALVQVEATLSESPADAETLGLDYLRGHLLEILDRPRQAQGAFADALQANPLLADYARYRLAMNNYRRGHPEVTAGLLATLLGSRPPAPLAPPAAELLARSIHEGGDCRLLQNLDSWSIATAEKRRLQLVRADCAARAGDEEASRTELLALLRADVDDEAARGAAERIANRAPELARSPQVALALGRAFYRNRQFDLAARFLGAGLAFEESLTDESPEEIVEARYDLARSHFWLRDYLVAASHFGRVAAHTGRLETKARALFQQGRCHELYGSWQVASNSYRYAYLAQPTGRWADASLLAALRVEWRLGSEVTALDLYDVLLSRREWRSLRQRAALFMASSDLVRSRPERVGPWLAEAARGRDDTRLEAEYWYGRLAELESDPNGAAQRYLNVLASDPYHPIAQAARERLARPPLASFARALGRRLAESSLSADLARSWALLGDSVPEGSEALEALRRRLAANSRNRPFLDLAPEPPDAWPLWNARLAQPEEMLLALGVWDQAEPVVLKHFPVSNVALGITGSRLLRQASQIRRSLYIAEILNRRVPEEVPAELLPIGFRRLLFPLPYREAIEAETRRRDVDPLLLAALIREESRFDLGAVSLASARGLAQMVLPTANRLARQMGIENLRASDLHNPQVSIALGAEYLRELGQRFGDGSWAVIAAYNAGEDQAQLWQSYCYSREPAEYFSKVGFQETRGYLRKVLSSRAHYAEIYLDLTPEGADLPAL